MGTIWYTLSVSSKCVLIVDCEPGILDAIQLGLFPREFKVLAFTDALSALDHFSSNSKDHRMIISDIKNAMDEGV
jgi:DNA-binding NtrC family response regulator